MNVCYHATSTTSGLTVSGPKYDIERAQQQRRLLGLVGTLGLSCSTPAA